MGPCERRGPRWWHITAVGVLLVQLSQTQTTPLPASCSANAVQYDIVNPHYLDTIGENPTATFISAPVQSFLNAVQPRPFPKDLIQEVLQEPQNFDETKIKKVLQYEIGFLVCAAIGVLYIVLMPVVGFILACCRCCGHCGGNMYQEQKASTPCRRRALYWSLFLTTIIILAGNICMFTSNQAVKESVESGIQDFNRSVDNVRTFAISVPKQAAGILNESAKVVDAVTDNIDAVGPQLGSAIQTRLRDNLDPTVDSVRNLDRETRSISDLVNDLNSMLDQLQSNVDGHQANLDAVKNNLGRTLSKPDCVGCSDVNNEVQQLTLPSSVNRPSMSQFQSALDEVIKINLTSIGEEADNHVNSIPKTVREKTQEVAEKTKEQLKSISDLTGQVDLSFMSTIDDLLNQVSRQIDDNMPQVERAEEIRWKVTIALCVVVVLVVLCNVLGLVLGPLGLRHAEDPTKRSGTADCGGTFLMMSAGISFLFSWLFMIIVLLLFLIGGNVYTAVCQPWRKGELLKFVDSLDVVPELSVATASGGKIDYNISDVYSDCQMNRSLWSAVHLDQVVDLDDLLNVTKYTSGIEEQLGNLDIPLSDFTLMTPEAKQQLSRVSADSGSVDFGPVRQQSDQISNLNLNVTADKLDELAAIQPNSQTRTEISDQAAELRQIQSNFEMTTVPLLRQLDSTVDSLQTAIGRLTGAVSDLLNRVEATQTFLNTQTSPIVKDESRAFLDCQIGYFAAYVGWARVAITEQVGRCGPVANAVDSVEAVVCSNLTESVNAFWFSLGWCIIFFIPSIILTIKLAKYYRRMKYSDVAE